MENSARDGILLFFDVEGAIQSLAGKRVMTDGDDVLVLPPDTSADEDERLAYGHFGSSDHYYADDWKLDAHGLLDICLDIAEDSAFTSTWDPYPTNVVAEGIACAIMDETPGSGDAAKFKELADRHVAAKDVVISADADEATIWVEIRPATPKPEA